MIFINGVAAGDSRQVGVQGQYVYLADFSDGVNNKPQEVCTVTVTDVAGRRSSYDLQLHDKIAFPVGLRELIVTNKSGALRNYAFQVGWGEFVPHLELNAGTVKVEPGSQPLNVLVGNDCVDPVKVELCGVDAQHPLQVEVQNDQSQPMAVSLEVDVASIDPNDPTTWKPSIISYLAGSFHPLEVDVKNDNYSPVIIWPANNKSLPVEIKEPVNLKNSPFKSVIFSIVNGEGISLLPNNQEPIEYFSVSANVKGTGGGKIRVNVYQIGGTTTGTSSSVTFQNVYGTAWPGVYYKKVNTITFKRLLNSFECEANDVDFYTPEVEVPLPEGNTTDFGRQAVLVEVEHETGVTLSTAVYTTFINNESRNEP